MQRVAVCRAQACRSLPVSAMGSSRWRLWMRRRRCSCCRSPCTIWECRRPRQGWMCVSCAFVRARLAVAVTPFDWRLRLRWFVLPRLGRCWRHGVRASLRRAARSGILVGCLCLPRMSWTRPARVFSLALIRRCTGLGGASRMVPGSMVCRPSWCAMCLRVRLCGL